MASGADISPLSCRVFLARGEEGSAGGVRGNLSRNDLIELIKGGGLFGCAVDHHLRNRPDMMGQFAGDVGKDMRLVAPQASSVEVSVFHYPDGAVAFASDSSRDS